MIDKMLANLLPQLVPLAFQKLQAVPAEHKKLFAQYVGDLALAYKSGDRVEWDRLLAQAPITETWKTALTGALWSNDNSG